MKTLKNYCTKVNWTRYVKSEWLLDIAFYTEFVHLVISTTVSQLADRFVAICQNEGMHVDKNTIEKVLQVTRQDMRQVYSAGLLSSGSFLFSHPVFSIASSGSQLLANVLRYRSEPQV